MLSFLGGTLKMGQGALRRVKRVKVNDFSGEL